MKRKEKDGSWKAIFLVAIILLLIIIIYNAFKTKNPEGTSIEGTLRDSEVKVIYDLTYGKNGEIIYEKNIFNKIKSMVKEAKEFIVIDMFLFNGEYNRKDEFEDISNQLTQLLVQKKKETPNLEVVFITDEINTFYGSYDSKNLEQLKDNEIQVVMTDLEKLSDPNPIYSGIWRTFFSKIESNKKGSLPNPLGPDSPKVTLPSYLKVLNMKANHRKVVLTENEALVTSFNVHDASSNHSNIALAVKGKLINDLLETEKAVVEFSGGKTFNLEANSQIDKNSQAQIITEGKIKDSLIKEIKGTKNGDEINMAMFYLGDVDIVDELLKASNRDVKIKIILDANKDAFGREKNGIPNRPVAYKLVNDSKGKIKVRWYKTHGEQFHTKMTTFFKESETILIGGSANLTRRNIRDYNLETNLRVVFPKESSESMEVKKYFNKIWNNEEEKYTLDFGAYEEKSIVKYIIYYIQEKTGLSSF